MKKYEKIVILLFPPLLHFEAKQVLLLRMRMRLCVCLRCVAVLLRPRVDLRAVRGESGAAPLTF